MLDKISQTKTQLETELNSISSLIDLDNFRIKFLTRKGIIAELFEELKSISIEIKPHIGKVLNELRTFAQNEFEKKNLEFESVKNKSQKIDLTIPGKKNWTGTKHPLTQTLGEVKRIFSQMGFQIAQGPEIEDDYHNFEALNFPPNHPARDMQDTFFISEKILLRTHTSPVQIRIMEKQSPPIRVIIPGRVYRNEAISSRSYCLFHQVEGLYVDEKVSFSELKGTLVAFVKQFYGSNLKYKFRPSFFPFTEPSAEMDISCFLCNGKGCRVCKFSGWLEILGCGMVHPNIFKNINVDTEKYSGYAFGMGIERIAMLLYGVDDIRLFYENDVRFLKQF